MGTKKSKAERFVETAAEQFRGLIEALNVADFNTDGECSYAIAGFLGYAPHKYYRGCPFVEIVTANCAVVRRKALLLGFEAHYAEKCTEVSTPELLVKIWGIPTFSFDERAVDFFGKPLRIRFLSKNENISFVKERWGLLGELDTEAIGVSFDANRYAGISDEKAVSDLVTRHFWSKQLNFDHNHSEGSKSCRLCRIGEICD